MELSKGNNWGKNKFFMHSSVNMFHKIFSLFPDVCIVLFLCPFTDRGQSIKRWQSPFGFCRCNLRWITLEERRAFRHFWGNHIVNIIIIIINVLIFSTSLFHLSKTSRNGRNKGEKSYSSRKNDMNSNNEISDDFTALTNILYNKMLYYLIIKSYTIIWDII